MQQITDDAGDPRVQCLRQRHEGTQKPEGRRLSASMPEWA